MRGQEPSHLNHMQKLHVQQVSRMEGIQVIFTQQTTNRIRDILATSDGKWEAINHEEDYKKRNFQESFVIKILEQQENETNRSQGQSKDKCWIEKLQNVI